jgi:hypothetical protein
MKKFLYLLIFPLLMASCGKKMNFSVKNPIDVERKDEAVVLARMFFDKQIKTDDSLWPVFKSGNKLLSSQVDDLNGDGFWDEAVVLIDFNASETKKINVEFISKENYPQFEKRTNLRLGILQEDGTYKEADQYEALPCDDGFEIIAQGESVSWENDKMGFRVYFDCRNVKDLYGKLKPEMILDKIHTPEIPDYHKLGDWGMDVLHCGSSLGSGGIAILKDDSLFRLGSTKFYQYHKITEGPVRSVFELRYDGWAVENDTLEAIERISVYPGKYWFESDVTVFGCPDSCQIVTGIVTSKLTRQPFQFQAGNFQAIGTHDIQSLNNDELGMAILVPSDETGKIARTTDIDFFNLGFETVIEKKFSKIISQTYFIGQNCISGEPSKHFFLAVWGLEKEQWKTEDGFKKYISSEAEKLSSPLEIVK